MQHRRLGRSGLQVSSLCLGAMTFGESQTFMKGVTSPDDEARRVLDRSLEAGIDFIDTADVYSEGRSEELLGSWLGPRRKDVILATKCRGAIGGKPTPHNQGLSARYILRACEDSLRRLKTEWIDLYQAHMQEGATPIEETLRAFEDLVRSGKVRYIGCSNYTAYRVTESLWAADQRDLGHYQSVQLQWNLIERGAERELVPACRAFELGVLAWGPLARGFLSGKYDRSRPAPSNSRLAEHKDSYRLVDNERGWAVLDAVKEVAREVESTPARVSLAWLLARPECTSVIIGARDVAQLEDNLAAADLGLSAAQVEKLDKASAPDWGYPYSFIAQRERW